MIKCMYGHSLDEWIKNAWMNELLNKPVSRPWAPCSPRSTPPPSRTRISPPQGIHLDPGVPVDPYAFLEQIYTVYPGTETQFIPGTCKQFLPQVRSTLFPQDPMVSVMHTALGALDGLVRGLFIFHYTGKSLYWFGSCNYGTHMALYPKKQFCPFILMSTITTSTRTKSTTSTRTKSTTSTRAKSTTSTSTSSTSKNSISTTRKSTSTSTSKKNTKVLLYL